MIRKKIGEIAVYKNWIRTEERDQLLTLQQQLRSDGAKEKETLFGQLLIEHGACSIEMVEDLLNQQNTSTEFLFYSLKSGGVPFSFGKYSIESLIGEGGMGDVYKVKDVSNNYLALKTINWKNYSHKLKKRFLREISMLLELKHPNIVPVYDCGQINGVDFLVMEYLKGLTLEKAIVQKSFSYREWLEKFLGLLKAMAAIHQKNIIHRDLKPTNIILTESQKLVLIDFGLSKNTENSEHTSLFTTHPIGTPAYMAPEQIFTESEPDHRADIWALGVIFYQTLTAKMPFYDRNMQRLIHIIQSQTPKSICEHNRKLPLELDFICKRALEKDRYKRYQTVVEMVQDIENFLEGKTLHIPKVEDRLPQAMLVAQRYTVLEMLGRGATGVVYKVEEVEKQKIFALKTLHPYLLQNEHFHKLFLKHASKALKFKNTHALQVHQVDQTEEFLFYVMDFSQGTSLKDMLIQEKILHQKKAQFLILQVLTALSSCHRQGLLHLNLKPANIMVEIRQNQLYALLCDIGIAKVPVNPESTYYMAPEQISGDLLNKQSDLYSMGVIYYEMLTGRLPFEGNSLMEVSANIISHDYLSAHKANTKISQKIADVIDKALEKNPCKRFENVDEFIKAIERAFANG